MDQGDLHDFTLSTVVDRGADEEFYRKLDETEEIRQVWIEEDGKIIISELKASNIHEGTAEKFYGAFNQALGSYANSLVPMGIAGSVIGRVTKQPDKQWVPKSRLPSRRGSHPGLLPSVVLKVEYKGGSLKDLFKERELWMEHASGVMLFVGLKIFQLHKATGLRRLVLVISRWIGPGQCTEEIYDVGTYVPPALTLNAVSYIKIDLVDILADPSISPRPKQVDLDIASWIETVLFFLEAFPDG